MPSSLTLRRLSTAILLTMVALVLSTTAAHANAVTSTNWSGYAVHRSGVHFRSATAEWRQPDASCASTATYSSFWVGIGGYRKGADALEQVGTELDCGADGTATSSAWYELVPAGSRAIRMTIRSGNLIKAAVDVADDEVRITLADLTTGARFSHIIHDGDLDTTSADWIAEAPSECAGSSCSILPLADFGTARFLTASATTTTGMTRSLNDAPWTRTELTMNSASITHDARSRTETRTSARATRTEATSGGAFSVTYSARSSTTTSTSPSSGPPSPGGGPQARRLARG